MRFLLTRLLCVGLPSLAVVARIAAQESYRNPIPSITRILDAPALPAVLPSLDGSKLLLLERPGLPSIAQLAGPELRLAGERINPRNNAQSRLPTFSTLIVQPVPKGDPRRIVVPWHARVGEAMWSPNGDKVAFTLVEDGGVSLWLADASSGAIRMLAGPTLNAAFGRPCRWLPSGSGLICLRIVLDRTAPPEVSPIPSGPLIQESEGKRASPSPEGLLQSIRDEALFEYYFSNQIVQIPLSGNDRPIGGPGLHSSVEVSPDGRYLLVETLHRPFSRAVSWRRFPRKTEVWDFASGSVLKAIADVAAQENPSSSSDAVVMGPRSVAWRTDVPASICWSEALDGGDPQTSARLRDRILLLDGPFTGNPSTVVDLEYRTRDIVWGGRVALVSEEWQKARRSRTWLVDLRQPGSAGRQLSDLSGQDGSGDLGRFLTRNGPGGPVLLTSKDLRFAFLSGEGASPDGSRPFLDRMDLGSGKTLRLWSSEAPYFEQVAAVLDPDAGRVLTVRESAEEPANWYLRDLRKNGAAQLTRLTSFTDPEPEFAGLSKQLISYQRGDGVQLAATLYLPPGYDKNKGPLPFVLWVDPAEPESGLEASPPGGPFRFTRPAGASPLFLLLAGYGVLENPGLPIVTVAGKEPNDTYVEQLVADAEAAIEKVVAMGVADPKRIAIGGNANGAFTAVNLLAHSDLFRAGVAGNGIYNGTLVPFGFETETRSYWEAPPVYERLSPFNHADKIKAPLLLMHGTASGEAGATPLQSERLYAALQGLGAKARLVLLPAETRGYQARESVGQVLFEMVAWLDRYVKGEK